MALCTGAIHFYVASYALSKMDFSITTIDVVYSRLFLFLLLVYHVIVVVRLKNFTLYFYFPVLSKRNFILKVFSYVDDSPYRVAACLYPIDMLLNFRYKNTRKAAGFCGSQYSYLRGRQRIGTWWVFSPAILAVFRGRLSSFKLSMKGHSRVISVNGEFTYLLKLHSLTSEEGCYTFFIYHSEKWRHFQV